MISLRAVTLRPAAWKLVLLSSPYQRYRQTEIRLKYDERCVCTALGEDSATRLRDAAASPRQHPHQTSTWIWSIRGSRPLSYGQFRWSFKTFLLGQ